MIHSLSEDIYIYQPTHMQQPPHHHEYKILCIRKKMLCVYIYEWAKKQQESMMDLFPNEWNLTKMNELLSEGSTGKRINGLLIKQTVMWHSHLATYINIKLFFSRAFLLRFKLFLLHKNQLLRPGTKVFIKFHKRLNKFTKSFQALQYVGVKCVMS